MILFKKKNSLIKQNSAINGEWGSVSPWMKKITSGKRRMVSKEIIKEQLEN